MIESALEAGQESVKRGPDLLPVLREAGVVDAGGYGLTVLLAGIVGALRGGEAPPLEHHAAARVSHPQHASTTFRYCTNFAVTGAGLEQRGSSRRSSRSATRCWWSATPRRSRSTSTLTIPTPRPRCSPTPGVVSHLDVADMREQVQAP